MYFSYLNTPVTFAGNRNL